MTIFDKILAGEIPAKVVYQDDDVFAFHDINPQAPVHVLVIPKRKRAGFVELSTAEPEEVGVLFRGASKVAKELGLDDDGYRIVVNQGRNGQQTVDYIHVHILGGRTMSWPPG